MNFKIFLIGVFAIGLLFPGLILSSFGLGEGGPIECPASYEGGVLLKGKFSGSAIKSLTCDYLNPNYKDGDQKQMPHYEFLVSYFADPGTSSSSEQCSGQYIPYGIYDYYYSSEIYASVGIQVAKDEVAKEHLDWAKENFLDPLIESREATPCTPLKDSDGDGTPDQVDLCEGFDDKIDYDNDGIPDECDYDTDTDEDQDGVIDSEDNCVFTSNKDQSDIDNNGLGDVCDPQHKDLTPQELVTWMENLEKKKNYLDGLSSKDNNLYEEIASYMETGVFLSIWAVLGLSPSSDKAIEFESSPYFAELEKWYNEINQGNITQAEIHLKNLYDLEKQSIDESDSKLPETSSEEKIIQFDRAILEPKKNQPDSIKMTGTLDNPLRGEPIIFKITKPDGTTEEFSSIVTGKGEFANEIIVDDTWQPGDYTVEGFYLGQKIESSTFEIVKVEGKVPDWIKSNALWWSEGQIDDGTFVQGIQYLIKENILQITGEVKSSSSEGIPDWVKKNAGWWATGVISEDDFVNGIKYLIEQGVIKID